MAAKGASAAAGAPGSGVGPSREWHVHGSGADTPICEANLRGKCHQGSHCPHHHYPVPYCWQIHFPSSIVGGPVWELLPDADVVKVERAYCNFANSDFSIQICTKIFGIGKLQIKFSEMKAQYLSDNGSVLLDEVGIRRLSTESYGTLYLKQMNSEGKDDASSDTGFLTQWRWYLASSPIWDKYNGTISQAVIETKYLADQVVFRFELAPKDGLPGAQDVFLLSFTKMLLLHRPSGEKISVCRRPVFLPPEHIVSQTFLSSPEWKRLQFCPTLPENWYPINTNSDYELIPLDPQNMEFHLVASELVKSVPDAHIADIFRLQNPYRWHKYQTKKAHMEHNNHKPNEMQLFHGTSEDTVLAIFKQSFDWRCNGKNATLLGKGAYFARDASYSHKYAQNRRGGMRWMFMARVLVGEYVHGHRDYTRPPCKIPGVPHGDMFDSCVDQEQSPTIYVIFDNDQSYPEYAICYK